MTCKSARGNARNARSRFRERCGYILRPARRWGRKRRNRRERKKMSSYRGLSKKSRMSRRPPKRRKGITRWRWMRSIIMPRTRKLRRKCRLRKTGRTTSNWDANTQINWKRLSAIEKQHWINWANTLVVAIQTTSWTCRANKRTPVRSKSNGSTTISRKESGNWMPRN